MNAQYDTQTVLPQSMQTLRCDYIPESPWKTKVTPFTAPSFAFFPRFVSTLCHFLLAEILRKTSTSENFPSLIDVFVRMDGVIETQHTIPKPPRFNIHGLFLLDVICFLSQGWWWACSFLSNTQGPSLILKSGAKQETDGLFKWTEFRASFKKRQLAKMWAECKGTPRHMPCITCATWNIKLLPELGGDTKK